MPNKENLKKSKELLSKIKERIKDFSKKEPNDFSSKNFLNENLSDEKSSSQNFKEGLLRKNDEKEGSLNSDYDVTSDKSFMGKRMTLYFRTKLESEEKRICKLIKRKVTQMRESKDQSKVFEDMASEEAERVVYFRELEENRKTLEKIKEALKRIQQGKYGYCAITNKPIPVRRLNAIPVAVCNVIEQEKEDNLEQRNVKEKDFYKKNF